MSRKILTFAAALLYCATTFAQVSIVWDRVAGGSGSDFQYTVKQTSDGGYILGGYSNSGIGFDKSEANVGSLDYWLVKTDASGAIVWDKTFGGTSGDAITDLIQTADGGYAVIGQSNSPVSGDKTEPSVGGQDYWVVKTDAGGGLQWERTFGGTLDDDAWEILQASDGGYLLIGDSESPIGGDKTEASQGETDFWLVKLDAAGVKEWDKTLGGNASEFVASAAEIPGGGYMVGGTSFSPASGDVSDPVIGQGDYWIIEISSTGTAISDKKIGGAQQDWMSDIALTSDGGFVLAGKSTSAPSFDKTAPHYGGWDIWVVKITGAGVIEWDNSFGGTSNESNNEGGEIYQTVDGGYLVGTESHSGANGNKTSATNGSADLWAVKMNSAGIPVWDFSVGTTSTEVYGGIFPTSDNGYIIGGYSSETGISADKTVASNGGYDYWYVKVLQCVGTCATISGTVYADPDDSCSSTTGDSGLFGRMVEADDGTDQFYAVADAAGEYSFLLPGGTYTLTPVTTALATESLACGPGLSYTVTVADSGTSTGNDFFMTPFCEGVASIVGNPVSPSPFTVPCPTLPWEYCATYSNTGAFAFDFPSRYDIFHDPSMDFSATVPQIDCAGTLFDGTYTSGLNRFRWQPPTSLNPGESCSVCVTVDVLAISSPFESSAVMDVFCPANTEFATKLAETGSCAYDPNDKAVWPLGCGPNNVIPNGPLTYTVRFQNVGLGPATDVVLRDTLDSDLDPTTFQLLSTSHAVTSLQIEPGNVLVVRFDGIGLPPEISDPAGSRGSVQFRVSPYPSTPDGSEIDNSTAIFFDDLAPVITNTVTNTIVNGYEDLGVDLGPDATVYSGYPPAACVDLTADTTGGAGPYTHAWSTGATTASIEVCPTVSTSYTVTVTDSYSCSATEQTNVEVVDVSCGNKGKKVSICAVPPGNPANAHDICVSANAVPARLAGGSTLGPCP